MRTSVLSSALLLAGGAVAGCNGKSDACVNPDASIVAHTGEPVGEEVVHNDITLYITKPDEADPRTQARAGSAVLFLTDVFGLALTENKLLADSFARAGYLTVVPDLFNGEPAPGDINVPGFNTTAFLEAHEPPVTDPIIATAAAYLRTELNATRIGAPGYCFGGRYAFRALSAGTEGGAFAVGFAAHPSLLTAEEIGAVEGPVAVAAADQDQLFNAAARAEAEEVLLGVASPYQVNLYAGTQHGFGVRVDLEDAQQKYAKEEAFLQAVKWFDRFLVAA
ncbi:dienelactone hydrolase family-domain-containing protein [Chaetomium fimeti]|uniref:Dienelactone hydrolase family-domain-containing protein n=1 Tax=Chaetomium fimeti TaxID=1854472 RepID=A0AAE0LSP3_9PEZI|nr:dienelactone hydrolase family-domain-containing protein [Chaetomium fimeti]